MRNFKRFFGSSIKFTTKVLSRSVVAIVIILLRWSDIYTELIKDELPISWVPATDSVMNIFDQYSLWIAILIIIAVILYTYYEVDREIRDPKVTKQLKQFYCDLEQFFQRDITNDEELEIMRDDIEQNRVEIIDWVTENMDKSSLLRLSQRQQTGFAQFRTIRPGAFNAEHSNLIDRVIGFQESLINLIEKESWG